MKRVWGHVLAALSVFTGVAGTVPACVHNDSSIFIREVIATQYAHAGALCLFTADPAQTFMSSGVLDVALRQSYDAVYLVGNQLLPQVNANQLRTETSDVTIQGAIVRITNSKGRELGRYTRLTSATISPSSGDSPGFAPVGVTIVDPRTIAQDPDIQTGVLGGPLAQSPIVRLLTYVRFFGQTLGGQSVESNEFEYPVDVCNGCLIGFNGTSTSGTPTCAANGASGSQPPTPCTVGQDLVVDCSIVCQSPTSCQGASQPATDAGGGG